MTASFDLTDTSGANNKTEDRRTMMPEAENKSISAEDLDVLSDPALETPKSRPPGDLGEFLAAQHERFFETIKRFRGRVAAGLAERTHWMHELSSSLEAVIDCTRQRRHERAWQLMEDILDEHLGILKRMSLRHAGTVIGSRSWYRLTTWAGAKTRRDMFHLPFQMKAGSYRFSPPGRPALYLGNNVYVCWLECGCTSESMASCRVARFEIDVRDNEYFLDLPANHDCYLAPLELAQSMAGIDEIDPRSVSNSPYLGDVGSELVEYLSVWPLLMAISVQKLQPPPQDPPEYVIPQLMMQWVLKQKNLLGVRYFTTKFDTTTNSNDLSINLVLPTRTQGKTEGFCDFLGSRTKCTLPQSFADAMSAPDETLFTRKAADARAAALGRNKIKRQGSLDDYHRTPFGRMEYWLDRPDLAVAGIDSLSTG
jgi:hypothetical protein